MNLRLLPKPLQLTCSDKYSAMFVNALILCQGFNSLVI